MQLKAIYPDGKRPEDRRNQVPCDKSGSFENVICLNCRRCRGEGCGHCNHFGYLVGEDFGDAS